MLGLRRRPPTASARHSPGQKPFNPVGKNFSILVLPFWAGFRFIGPPRRIFPISTGAVDAMSGPSLSRPGATHAPRRRVVPVSGAGTAFPAPGAAFRAPGAAFRAPGTAFPAPGTAFPAPGTAFPAPGTAFRVPGTAFRVPGAAFSMPGTVPGTSKAVPGGLKAVPGRRKAVTTRPNADSARQNVALSAPDSTSVRFRPHHHPSTTIPCPIPKEPTTMTA